MGKSKWSDPSHVHGKMCHMHGQRLWWLLHTHLGKPMPYRLRTMSTPWLVGIYLYAIVAGISHAFWPCGMLFLTMCMVFFKPQKNFNLGCLKIRHNWNNGMRENRVCVVDTVVLLPFVGIPSSPHAIFGLLQHCWAPNSWRMAPHTTLSLGSQSMSCQWRIMP